MALFVLITAADKVPTVVTWNRSASLWLQGPDSGALWALAITVEWLFSAEITFLLALAGIALLWLLGRKQLVKSLALFFPLALAAAGLKFLIAIPGPLGFLLVRHGVIGPPSSTAQVPFSYPSGHAARAAFLVIWLCLVLFANRHWSLVVLGALMAAGIGWTRIYLGAHFLFDILGALALATAALVPAAVLANQANWPKAGAAVGEPSSRSPVGHSPPRT